MLVGVRTGLGILLLSLSTALFAADPVALSLSADLSLESVIEANVKEEKIAKCASEYMVTQLKSRAKSAKENLYNLIHNFDDIVLILSGSKGNFADKTYEEKLEVLARLQCETYYKIGTLR